VSAEIQRRVLTLLGDIQDVVLRTNIATAVNIIVTAYINGDSDEESARNDLIDVCENTLAIREPNIADPDVKKKVRERAEALADEIIRYAKAIRASHILLRRQRGTLLGRSPF